MKNSRKLTLVATTMAAITVATVSGCVTMPKCEDIPSKSPSEPTRTTCNYQSRGGNISYQIAALEDDSTLAQFTNYLISTVSAQVAFSPASFDANLVRLSTSGSQTAPNDTSGTAQVRLYRGNALLGTTSAPWARYGSEIILSNPGALNTWVQRYPQADGYLVDYQISYTPPTQGSALATVSEVYNGTIVSSTTSSIQRPGRISYQEQ